MKKYKWSYSKYSQLERYAKYLTKLELMTYGLDIYQNEINDKSIDFLIRTPSNYLDIQVKSLFKSTHVYLPKSTFPRKQNLILAFVHYIESEPAKIFLIPSLDFNEKNSLLKSYDYTGKKSKSEFGMSTTKKNIEVLNQYKIGKQINKIFITQEQSN